MNNEIKVSWQDKVNYTKNLKITPLSNILDTIRRSDDLRKKVVELRNIQDETEQRKYKEENFPYFNLGTFNDEHRKNTNLISSSFFIFDYDHLDDSKLESIKDQLKQDNRVFAFFVSPRGNGLKLIYRLDKEISDHGFFSRLYKHYAKEFKVDLGADPDKTSDASRSCYFSFDPDLYVNEKCVTLSTEVPEVPTYNIPALVAKPGSDDLMYVPSAIEFLREHKLEYSEWLSCGLALAALGETGRRYFHSLSNNPHYQDTEEEIDYKFDNFLQTKSGSVTLASLFHLAIEKGYTYPEITEQVTDNDFAKELEDQFHRDDTRDPNKLLGFTLTKFKQLAKNIDGLQPGFYLIGAESNIGKTAVLTNLCLDLLETNPDVQVLYFSLDDNRIYTTYRLLSIKTQFHINDVRKKQVDVIRKIGLDNARSEIIDLVRNQRLILKDISHVTHIDHIEAEIKKVADQSKLVVFIDGLYNLDVTASKNIREENIERAKKVKVLVDTYRIPIITTGELRKKSKEENKDKTPTMHDVMETGKFVYNANIVWMLYGKAEELKSATPTLTLEYVKNKLSDNGDHILPHQLHYRGLMYITAISCAGKALMEKFNTPYTGYPDYALVKENFKEFPETKWNSIADEMTEKLGLESLEDWWY